VKYTIPPSNDERLFHYTHHISIDHVPNARVTNIGLEEHKVEIENLRGNESAATLDSTGFQFFLRPAKHREFRVDEEIWKEYYLKSEHLIKELTGASRVVLFNHSTSKVRGCASVLIFRHSYPSAESCPRREVAPISAGGRRACQSDVQRSSQPSSSSFACSRCSQASGETLPDHQSVVSHLARCI
jgi:hypothetical protein